MIAEDEVKFCEVSVCVCVCVVRDVCVYYEPLAAAIMESPMPVFPLVASMI